MDRQHLLQEKETMIKVSFFKSIQNALWLGGFIFYRDFQWRYRITFLGYLWAIIRPLFMALPIIFVGKQFNLADESINYEAYAFTGFIFFKIFTDAIEFPQLVMWRARKIMKDIAPPFISIIIAGCYYVIINLCVYAVLLIIAFFVFDATLQPTFIFGFLCIPLFIFAGLSLGIVFSPFALFYLDLRYGFAYISTVLMWFCPIFYTIPHGGLIGIVNRWNPLTYLISVPRFWILGGVAYSDNMFLLSSIIFIILFLLALRFYNKAMPIAIECVL